MIPSKAYPLRVRLVGEIVAEIVLPLRQTGKIAIIAIGLPSMPSKGELLHFLAEQGYVAVFPRYRGTWESEGSFLDQSPARDIADVIDSLSAHPVVRDLATGQETRLRVMTFHLFGSSFGGPAVILNSEHPLVKKVIALSPVLDWSKEGEDEPFEKHIQFVTAGFGDAYRLKKAADWQKLIRKDFYNPITQTGQIDGRKIFIVHAKDDHEFRDKTKAAVYLKPQGGHNLRLTHQFLWKKIQPFLASH